MECIVENMKVNFNNVTIREMGFGHDFFGYVPLPYCFTLTRHEFFEKFEIIFNDFVAEIKADDEQYGDEDVFDLHEQGYPNLEDAMADKKEFLSQFIKENLAVKFLDQYFGSINNPELQYIINSIDDIAITDDLLTVTGNAFKKRAS